MPTVNPKNVARSACRGGVNSREKISEVEAQSPTALDGRGTLKVVADISPLSLSTHDPVPLVGAGP